MASTQWDPMAPDELRTWISEQLFDVAPIAIATIDPDFNVVQANAAFEAKFGEWQGRKCYQVYKDREALCPRCMASRSFEDGKSRVTPEVGVDEHGSITHYIKHTVPIVRESGEIPYLVEMSIDITESLRLEDELHIAHDFLKTLIATSADAIVGVNADQEVRVVNPAARDLFKIADGESLSGDQLVEILPRGLFDEVFSCDRSLLMPETTVRATDGEEIPVRLAGACMESGGKLLGGAISITDHRELRDLQAEKLEAERLAAVGQTVAGLAHGVKNLLTGLEGGMYLMSTGLKKGNQKRVDNGWDMLNRNIVRISRFVRDFLSFSKGRTITVESADPVAVAREVVSLYVARAEEAGVKLTWSAAGDIAPANLDFEGLHDCLTNLVGNAMDACQMSEPSEDSEEPSEDSAESAAESAAGSTVHVCVSDEDGVLRYSVTDNGVGMDYELKQKVFTTFFTTKGLGGTGLGLLTTRKIIQDHGGRIELESTTGKGSTFTILLPRDRLPAGASASATDDAPDQGA